MESELRKRIPSFNHPSCGTHSTSTDVPDYFLSDVHLRPDRPDRGQRLARLVETLEPTDALYVVGDLCDFWFASRQAGRTETERCPGLKALIRFVRNGGALTVLPGNHDAWLGPFYEQTLGARFIEEGSLSLVSHGLRVHLVHGHRLGGRSRWKGVMESKTFLNVFGALPGWLAGALESRLESTNQHHREASNQRHLAVYRQYANARADRTDLVLFGHVHGSFDESCRAPRWIVLGDWLKGTRFLKIDADGPHFVVEPGPVRSVVECGPQQDRA